MTEEELYNALKDKKLIKIYDLVPKSKLVRIFKKAADTVNTQLILLDSPNKSLQNYAPSSNSTQYMVNEDFS